ncbi:hypothetical protein COLO4_17749 [Corchorus olitorius]|uniref:TF-B3 domain-containing protein n=1 Tax=Corchorus olitorius TaxID=93759 RepID=A0A1R3JBP8_9ROSI|nr:hypothetical protein COLO4_17749 [Corchorus olitorius]
MQIFSKLLTETDIKKRLAIPSNALPFLPDFNNGRHAVDIRLLYGTRVWPIICSVRKTGYKKPVFSGGWRDFVTYNQFNVGDEFKLHKVQHQTGSFFYYRVEVDKNHPNSSSAAASSSSIIPKTLIPPALSSTNIFLNNFEQEPAQLFKVAALIPVKEERAFTDPSPTDHATVTIFGTAVPVSDESTSISKDQFKNEHEPEINFFGAKPKMGISGMSEPSILAYYTTKSVPEMMIKPFDLDGVDGSLAYNNTRNADAEAYNYKSKERLKLDLVLAQPTPIHEGQVNLDLTLALPLVDTNIYRRE